MANGLGLGLVPRQPNDLSDVIAALDKLLVPGPGLGPSTNSVGHDALMALPRKTYEVLVFHFGKTRAKTIWAGVPKAKPGRPKGVVRDPEGDASFLRIFDYCYARGAEVKTLPRRMAKYFTSEHPHQYPISQDSLEQHIRRLLKRRE
jgi:hypothetical protein